MARVISFLVFFSLLAGISSAQAPRFTQYGVAETGAKVYFPMEPIFDMSLSEDQSEVYSAEVEFEGVVYGAIIVRLSESLPDDPAEWESLLLSYMDFLNESAFSLTDVVDPGLGHTLESHPEAKGALQFGEDADGNKFAVKGWADAHTVAVMYVKAQQEVNVNVQNLFLDGFRFPAQ
jgi:hypothetical protein